MIDREGFIHTIKTGGPVEALRWAKRQGYARSTLRSGAIVLTDGFIDFVFPPVFTMRQAREYQRALMDLPHHERPTV